MFLLFLFGFIFFTTLITHYFCSFESESSNGPGLSLMGLLEADCHYSQG